MANQLQFMKENDFLRKNSLQKQWEINKRFIYLLNAKIKTKGIVNDPNYLEHCLKIFFINYANVTYDYGYEKIVIEFVTEIERSADWYKRLGYSEWDNINVLNLINSSSEDRRRVKAAEFIVYSITDTKREDWLN